MSLDMNRLGIEPQSPGTDGEYHYHNYVTKENPKK